MRSPTVAPAIFAPRVPGLWRVLVAWGALTLASLVGPCRHLSPSPALAADASP